MRTGTRGRDINHGRHNNTIGGQIKGIRSYSEVYTRWKKRETVHIREGSPPYNYDSEDSDFIAVLQGKNQGYSGTLLGSSADHRSTM